MGKKYHIYTYGCQMNVHESEKLAGILSDKGYTETDNVQDADVIVFNTCCIRESAETHAYGNIGALKKLKKQKKFSEMHIFLLTVRGVFTKHLSARWAIVQLAGRRILVPLIVVQVHVAQPTRTQTSPSSSRPRTAAFHAVNRGSNPLGDAK